MKRSDVIRIICEYWAKTTGQGYAEPDEQTQDRMIKAAIALGRDDICRYIRMWTKMQAAKKGTRMVMLKDAFPPKYVAGKINWREICIPTMRATVAIEQAMSSENQYPPPKPDVPKEVRDEGEKKFREMMKMLRESGWNFAKLAGGENDGKEDSDSRPGE